MIIGITGRAGAGKSTVGDILARDHKAVVVSLADEMKRICRNVYGFTDLQLWGPSEERNKPDNRYPRPHSYGKTHGLTRGVDKCTCCGQAWDYHDNSSCFLTPRFALQLLGTEWGRHCFEDTWARKTVAIARELLMFKGTLVSYDCRRGIATSVEPSDLAMVVIPDVRYDNEAKAIHAAGGKIIAKANAGVLASTHSSEAGISEDLIDAWIPYIVEDDRQKLTAALSKHVRAIVEGT